MQIVKNPENGKEYRRLIQSIGVDIDLETASVLKHPNKESRNVISFRRIPDSNSADFKLFYRGIEQDYKS